MYTRILTFALFILGLMNTSNAFENDLQSICKRPGTDELFIGGEFHILMVVDAKTGNTLRQFELDHNVMDMQFDPEGKQLIIYDGDKIHFVNPDSGEDRKTFDVGHVRLVEKAPFIVDIDWYGENIHIYSAADGSKIGSYQPGFDALDYGYSSDFSELLILGKSMEIENEASLIVKKVAKQDGYSAFNSAYTEQQEDGKGAGFAVYDLKTKSEKLKTVLPYTTSNSFDFNASKFGNNYYLGCWDMLLVVDPEGKATPVEPKEASFTYASASDPTGQYLFLAGTKSGIVLNCADGSILTFDAREDYEFSYTVDFAFDGKNVYMLSEDYSVINLDMKGAVQSRFTIERTAGNGFGVYYFNGFNKKEDRDKEAAIINKELEALGLPAIDLETKVGDSNLLLGVFGSMDGAEAFETAINSNGLQYLTKIAPVNEE